MTDEPTEADLDAFERARDATFTPVIVAPGQLPASKRTPVHGASRALLFWGELQGVRRVLIEDNDGVFAEITSARIASTRQRARPFDSAISVEVCARGEVDDGQREWFIIAGPKHNLRKAFEFLGHPLS